MTDLYLTRHGQTEWNLQVRMQGRGNSPLTEEGIRGAEILAKRLSLVPFSRCYTSPMPRAVHTALLLLRGRDVPLTITPYLAEMSLGVWEGVRMAKALEEYPDAFGKFRNRPDVFRPVSDGGEDFYEVCERAREFLRVIESLPEGTGPILGVTHCILLQAIMMIVDNRGMETLRSGQSVDQTSLFRLHFDGAVWTVLERNGIALEERESSESDRDCVEDHADDGTQHK